VPTGQSTVTLRNVIGAFVDVWDTTENKVIIHIMPMLGDFVTGGTTLTAGSSFLKVITLVR